MKHSFSAPIESAQGGGAYVRIPFDVEQAFGKKRVPVQATIDGVAYRGSLVSMGGPSHVLGVLKAIRAQLGKDIGDVVEVTIEEDEEPRQIEAPQDLSAALDAEPTARKVFDALSYSHKREYVRWIEEAKRAETRSRRVDATVAKLLGGEQLEQ